MNLNEQMTSTMAAQESHKPFKYNEFAKMLKLIHVSGSDFKSYISRPDVLDCFRKPLHALFPRKEQNPSEAWTSSKITTFSSNQTPITQIMRDCISVIAGDLNMSVIKVFEYLDQFLKNNPYFISVITQPNLFSAYQSHIEDAIATMFIADRYYCLVGVYFAILELDSENCEKRQILQDVIGPMLESNSLINVLLETYQHPDQLATAPYFRKNPQTLITGKQREEYQLLNMIFTLLVKRRVTRDVEKIFKKLHGIFMKQKFNGLTQELCEQLKINLDNEAAHMSEISEKSSILSFYILLTVILQGLDFQPHRQRVNLHHLNLLNSEIQQQIENQPEEAKTHKTMLFDMLYGMIIKASMLGSNNLDNNCAVFDQVLKFLDLNIDEEFSDFVILLAKESSKFDEHTSNSLRNILKMLLDVLAFLNQAASDIMDANFNSPENKTEVLLTIFKESMKNVDVLCRFWRSEMVNGEDMPSFVREYLFSYPYNKLSFLSILDCLIGYKEFEFTTEMLDVFADMSRYTVRLENTADLSMIALGRQSDQFSEDIFETRRPVESEEGIYIQSGVRMARKRDADNVFEVDDKLNLWEVIYKDLSEFVSANQTQRRVIVPLYITKSIRLIAKILILNPDAASLFQQILFAKNPGNITDYAPTEHTSILYFLLFDIYNLIYENPEYVKTTYYITRAFKALLTSTHQDSVSFFLKLYPLVSQSADNHQKNSLLRFFLFFEAAEHEGDEFKRHQRYSLSVLINILQIFKILIADDELWVNNLMFSMEQPFARASHTIQQNAGAALQKIAQEYTKLTEEGSWLENYANMQTLFDTVYGLREMIPYNLLDEMWNNLIIPLCRRYLGNDFEVDSDNVKLKYDLYRSIFELINCVLNKLSYKKSKRQLKMQDSKTDYKQLSNAKVHSYLASLPIIEMIKCALNVTVDINPYKIQVSSKKSSRVGVHNTHWEGLVQQRLVNAAGLEALEFFTTVLETLTLTAKVCRQEYSFNMKKTESRLLREFFSDFCYRESIHKYIVSSANDSQAVNIFVALISLIVLDYDREINKLDERSLVIQRINLDFMRYEWVSSDLLFQSVADSNAFALLVNKDLLYERAFDGAKIQAKAYSVSEAGFAALTEILKFWQFQTNVKKPNFDDYIIGLHNDMPNSKVLMNEFLFALNRSISAGFSSAYDFLLQVQQSQPRFLEELFKLTELGNKHGSNVLFTILVKMLKALSVLANAPSNPAGILNARENFFKLSLLILRLLQSSRISKTLIDEMWSICFDLLSESILRHLSESADPFECTFNFIVEIIAEESMKYNGKSSIGWSLNMQRLYYLTRLGKLQDKVFEELLNLVSSAFFQKFTKKKIHFFESHAINFFKNFSLFSQRLFKGIISENILSGYSLVMHLQENQRALLAEAEHGLFYSELGGYNRTSFLGQAKSIYDPKLSFVASASATPGTQEVTQESGKITFDPNSIYLVMRTFGASQMLANRLAYLCSFQNQIDLVMDSKSLIQSRLIDFLDLIYSVGLQGCLASSSFNQLPNQSLSEYIANASKKLQGLQSDYLGMSFYLLSTQFMSLLSKSSTGFIEKLQLNTDVTIQNNEKAFLNPFASKTGTLKFSLLNILVKENGQQIGESDSAEIMDWAFSRLEQCKSLLDYFITNFVKPDASNSTYSNVSFDILSKIVKFTNSHLELSGHLITNIGTQNAQDTTSAVVSIKVLIGLLVQTIPMVLHFYSTFSTDIEFFLNCLLYSAFILKTADHKMDPDSIGPVKDLVMQVLLKSKKSNLLALNIFDTVFSQNSDQLVIGDIDFLSERMAQKDISPSEFNLIATILTNFTLASENKTKVISSNLLNNILNIKGISSQSNFQRCVLYFNGLPEDSHSMFCHLLTLVSTLLHLAKQTPGMWTFPLMFLSKFENRFLMMLRMNRSNISDDNRGQEANSQFQNQGFLEEISLILAFLSTISQDSEVWVSKNRQQFNKFFWTLANQTLQIFSHTIGDTNIYEPRPSWITVANRFQPVSKFEQQLQTIVLKYGGQSLHNKPTSSIMKSTYDPKASLNSELHQFREMKAAYMTHIGLNSTLFAFKLENLATESIFSLCGALSNMMGFVNFSELVYDVGDKFLNRLFFKDFNQSLTSIQMYAYYAYSKLTSRPETYKDGCVHLQVLADSTEARYQTKGISSLSCIFALTEMKNMVRKEFEMTYFLQNLSFQIFDSIDVPDKFRLSDELRKQKEKSWIMLQEFENNLLRKENMGTTMAHSRENLRPYSPMVTPYKSVTKFTPRNIGHDIASLDENIVKNLFVNMKSIEEHVKFLDFIKNYYPNK